MSADKPSSRVITIRLPEELAKQVAAVADEEHRDVSDLFRDAFQSYRLQRMERKLAAARAAAASRTSPPYREEDVETLVDEIRAQRYRSNSANS